MSIFIHVTVRGKHVLGYVALADKRVAAEDTKMDSDDKRMDLDDNYDGLSPQVNNTISCFPGFVLAN